MRRWLLIAALLGIGACALDDVGSLAGKSCEVAADCPHGYSCVLARPGQGRTCELLEPPGIGDTSPDGGSGGPAVYYCGDIEPILKASCVLNCHGSDHSGAPGQNGFRLDMYYDDANGILGAQTQAPRIKIRAADGIGGPMPPAPNSPLTTEQKQLVSKWALGGALFAPPDGGGCDGGPLP